MKRQKVLSIVCVLAMILSLLAGCGDNNTVEKNSFDTEIQSTRIGDTFIAENRYGSLDEMLKAAESKATKGISSIREKSKDDLEL